MKSRRLIELFGRLGVRSTLALATIPLTLLGALAIGMVTAALSTQEVSTYHVRAGQQMAATLAQRSDVALLYRSTLTIAETAGSLLDNPLVKEIRVVDNNGKVLFAKGNGASRDWPYPAAPAEGTATVELDDVWLFARQVRTAATPQLNAEIPEAALFGNTTNEALGQIQLVLSKEALFKARRNIFFGNVVAALGFSLLVVVAMLLLVRRFSRPLESLADRMHEARSGRWTEPEAMNGPREIRDIGDSYNALMATLRQREEQLREFNQDLEERIRQRTHALEAANKELEAFSYSASHDLRAPLRAIDGFGKALLEDYGATLDPLAQNYLQRMREAARRMSVLIDDMLRLSRVTRYEMQLSDMNMSEMAEAIAAALREQHVDHPVDFVVQPDMQVTADPELLHIMLTNLIGNAWKYTAKVAAARVEFRRTRIDHETVYVLRDNGAGFDMRFADKLFGAFQRLHGKEFEGTGIGLAIVQRILIRHGGRIWAEAAVDKGATFYFTLPDAS
jgi:signal transduction histidine kinase